MVSTFTGQELSSMTIDCARIPRSYKSLSKNSMQTHPQCYKGQGKQWGYDDGDTMRSSKELARRRGLAGHHNLTESQKGGC